MELYWLDVGVVIGEGGERGEREKGGKEKREL